MKRVYTRGCLRASAALLVLLLCILGPAHSGPAQPEPDLGPAPSRLLEQMAIPGTGELQLIIQLADPSVVEAMGSSAPRNLSTGGGGGSGASRMDLQSFFAVQYRARVVSAQKVMMERLSVLSGVRVQASVNLVMNAIFARVPIGQYNAIRYLPGVKNVYFSHEQSILLDTAATLQNAQALWDKTGGNDKAGKGIKIGIIDTGIDTDNPMFTDDSLVPPSGYPKGEKAYTNNKVIVARNYIDLLSQPQSVNTAIDEMGHGSFVAGCAAGKRVTAPLATIAGMAPGAFLGNYKVFGTPGINDRTNSPAVIAALEDAVADGMDILNLSLGSLSYAPPSRDPEIIAINEAIAAGVVVVAAAGNNGPETLTLDNPGLAPDAITVGSVSNSRFFASLLRATAPNGIPDGLTNVMSVSGTGPVINSKINSTSIVDVATLDRDGLGCLPFSAGSLKGKLAFISRGTCTFAAKVSNAANAGAVAVVVYNNVPGAGPSVMSGLGSNTIPAVMISNPDGLLLKSFIAANQSTAQIEIDATTAQTASSRILSSFSSVGPASDLGIKPDIVAVGESVYSAAQNKNTLGLGYNSTQFMTASGTSNASPMVAGAAAALRQLFPTFGPLDVKSALVTTASRNLSAGGTTPPNVMQAGAGLLDMGKAGTAGAIFTPTNLNFGVSPYSPTLQLTRTLVINNVSSISDRFSLALEPLISGPTISFGTINTGSIAPGGSASISVSVQAPAPLTGGFQGFVTAQSLQTSQIYRIPYWVGIYVSDRSRILTVSRNPNVGGAYSALTDALRAAQPGNIIEIADSGSFSGGIVIGTNEQGLPLHGITIRAKNGFTPKIDGTGSNAADIRVVGLQNVLLQGLTITGGLFGIQLTQPSASIPLSVTIDKCIVNGVADTSSSWGIVVDNGGTVQITGSTISHCTGLGIAAFDGTRLTVSNSTLDSNGAGIEAAWIHVDAPKPNVQILGTKLSNNSGPGALLEYCSGTIDGSRFEQNRGTYGDGIEIVDGLLTITNNKWDTNDRYGIFFSGDPGPGGVIAGNIVQFNGRYGIYLYPGQNVRVERNLVKDNGGGIRLTSTTTALLVNNIIVGSRDASNGDGVQVAATSDVRMINNTVYNNKHYGILLSSTAKVVVNNSIVSQNTRGDLVGFQPGNILFSLVGDGSIAGNNNTSGDPKLVDPDNNVFDLSPGSPALDAGSNDVTDLPLLDYYQRLRVASAGTRPGDGKVDMGAAEAGSTYPLFFPLLAHGDVSTLGDTFTTGFAVLNTTGDTVSANFTAYAPSGDLLAGTSNPSVQSIGSGAQVPILGFQLFGFDHGASRLGAVLANSAQKLAGFFLVFDKDFRRFADGVDVSSSADTILIFMRHQSDATGKTKYALFNPGVNAAPHISARLYDSTGAILDDHLFDVTIAPKGQYIFDFNSLTASSGFVLVRSDRPLVGIELSGSMSELAALRAVSAGTSTETQLYFPHFAVNQGFSTLIGMVNTIGGPPTKITLTAYDNDGRVIGGPILRQLSPMSQLLDSVSNLFNLNLGNLATGYIVAQCSQGGMVGFTAFRYDDGLVQSAAAVPVNSMPRQKLLFSHIAHQVAAGSGGTYQTGIAILNPYGVGITFKMSVFDGTGNKVAEQDFGLGPYEKVAKILSHTAVGAGFFTQPLPLASGHIEVTSDYGLLGFELFFTEDYSQLASVPAQAIN